MSPSPVGSNQLPRSSISNDSKSVKAEPLEQMASSLYSSHFSKAPTMPLSGMGHESSTAGSMLTGLPHLTPAPFNTHSMHQGFPHSLDEMKNHHYSHSHHHPHQDYSSFAASAASAASPFSSYSAAAVAAEHSNHINHHHHHHHSAAKLQTS